MQNQLCIKIIKLNKLFVELFIYKMKASEIIVDEKKIIWSVTLDRGIRDEDSGQKEEKKTRTN